ncbi:MAG: pathogenicity protein [Rhodanobacter sp.]|nr:MAG: pathogenicity protein [Rhodanobacter sp.]TAM13204.1 MAG: pathogenicity protein [Rhodanobacter sp.]TAM35376.1 MAG: pathogenicity protein [Rhodanobacter sp.]
MLALAWLGWSNAGLRFVLIRVQQATGGALHWQQAHGALFESMRLDGVRYDDRHGTRVAVRRVRLDLRFWPLLAKRVHVTRLDADGVEVQVPQSSGKTSTPGTFSLRPPVDIVLDRVHIGSAHVAVGGAPTFASSQLDLAGRWTRDGIAIDTLRLRAADGTVDLDGRVALARRESGQGKARFAWQFGAKTWAGTLTATADGHQARLDLALQQPMAATLHLTLAQDPPHAWSARLDAPHFDPAVLLGDTALRDVSLALQAQGKGATGELRGTLAANGYQLELTPLRAHYAASRHTLKLEQLALRSPQVKGQLDASGTFDLGTQPIAGNLDVRWANVLLPAQLVGQVLASAGTLKLDGTPERYRADARLTLGPPRQPVQLTLQLDGTPHGIALRTLTAQQAKSRLALHGQLDWAPALAWQLNASASAFNPGAVFAHWPGALDVDLASRGTFAANAVQGSLDIARLGGRLRGRPLAGSAHLELGSTEVLSGNLRLASGASRVQLDAKPGRTNDADLKLAVASLGDWLPQASGRLDGQFNLRGRWPGLAVNGRLTGSALHWQAQKLDQLQLIVGVPDTRRLAGKIELQTRGAQLAGLDFSQLHLRAEGSERDHQLELDARGTPLSARLALHGAQQGNTWAGALNTLNLEPTGMPPWHLRSTTRLAWRNGAFDLGKLCLTAGEPLLCVTGRGERNGRLRASYQLHALPLAALLDAAGVTHASLRVDGALDGDGQWQRAGNGQWSGRGNLSSPRGSVSWIEREGVPALAWSNLAAGFDLDAARQRIELHAQLDHGGRLAGSAELRGRQQALSGNVTMQLNDLGWLTLAGDTLANVHGTASAQFTLGGTLATPSVAGQAGIQDFAAEVPGVGLKLTGGKLVANTLPGHTLAVDGQVQSGSGMLGVRGQIGLGDGLPMQLAISGKQFTAASVPAAQIVVSPDLALRHDADGFALDGNVLMDRAEVNLDKLPGAGAPQASADVVVMDRPQAERDAALPVRATVKVDLGAHTHLVGYGLDGRLHGVLTVNQSPGQAATGQGQITVDGSYEAYGQKLQIERGKLLFAGTPLDNPGLAIRAVRKLNPNATIDEGQEVGLEISGTAKRPVLTIFSQPAMEQSDALAYLVTGKPLAQVTSGESNLLGSAAQTLGTAAGNLLAKSIGAQLGLDDVGVGSSDALGGGSAFTVGKYLSPRLYLSYGVGLFEPGEVVSLRYRLSRRWHFEAQSATNFNRASLNYRLEK